MSLHINTLSAGRCRFSAKRPQSRRWCGRVQLKRQRMPACVPRGSILATRRSIYSTIGCFILGSWQPRSARIRRPYVKYRIEYAVKPEIMQHKTRTLKEGRTSACRLWGEDTQVGISSFMCNNNRRTLVGLICQTHSNISRSINLILRTLQLLVRNKCSAAFYFATSSHRV